jgi:uncharacterized protein (TIGR03083 family)
MTDELDLLERILDGTAGLLAGVGDEQWTKPTPCPEYDVRALVSHITGWAQMFAASLRWEQAADQKEITPRMRERLDELTALLSGPATRGELRVLESYEAYFQTLFTLGWALVQRMDPGADRRRLPGAEGDADGLAAAETAWNEIRRAWIAPWIGRRRHQQIVDALMRWIDPPTPAMLTNHKESAP